ncbi:TetR/AcrR family transcriptional regulator [Alteromonas sp. a30]|uniref:TetR/AcrR family transcriptional regulator n=1 Tax=Alteromonas sp. a30 TaxID=2730917 RepID=UPI00227E5EAB|nr:TetR/AcrR family transcriptional regulator [Alteromonas sp. a30]MCY7296617.1 TetR/AcrR family transcriptional regulator [Alteromonas sp. a30]
MTTTPLPDNRLIKPEVLKKLKDTIIDCFSKGQFHEVGLREICRLAKVSPNTIYKYCGTKENLLYFCVKEDMDRLTNTVIEALKEPQDLRTNIQTFSDIWFDYYQQNPAIARIVFLNIPQAYWMSPQYFMQQALITFLQEKLLELQSQGEITPKLNMVHALDMIIGSVNRILIRWLTLQENADLAPIKASFVEFVICALSTDA